MWFRRAARRTSGVLYPDTLVGTDSHTTMINGLGVLGWGVGGIEAEAAMLGQPCYLITPRVVGFRLRGALPSGVTATDLVLTVTEILRGHGVVECFVEFFGEGLSRMPLSDRATVSNMAPEYGATMGFFPVDEETLAYLRRTGRSPAEVDRVEAYAKRQGMFRTRRDRRPRVLRSARTRSGAGRAEPRRPKRPQDRVGLSSMKRSFRDALTAPVGARGFGLDASDLPRAASAGERTEPRARIGGDRRDHLVHEHLEPGVMLGAGLLARNAVARGAHHSGAREGRRSRPGRRR